MARRNAKMTPEQTAKAARRAAMLDTVYAAIRDGRAYLDTFVGRCKVTSYDDTTGWAVTNNSGAYLDQRSFMVCLDSIKIA
jgi:hypothetical protein